jgi:mRNA interferase MazF
MQSSLSSGFMSGIGTRRRCCHNQCRQYHHRRPHVRKSRPDPQAQPASRRSLGPPAQNWPWRGDGRRQGDTITIRPDEDPSPGSGAVDQRRDIGVERRASRTGRRRHKFCGTWRVCSDQLPLSTWLVAPTSTAALPASFRPEVEIGGRTTRVLAEQTAAVDPARLGASQGHLTFDELRLLGSPSFVTVRGPVHGVTAAGRGFCDPVEFGAGRAGRSPPWRDPTGFTSPVRTVTAAAPGRAVRRSRRGSARWLASRGPAGAAPRGGAWTAWRGFSRPGR